MLSIIEARFPETVEAGEFEIVLGTRQVASTLFVATVVLVVFCAVSYLGGKAASVENAPLAQPAALAVQPVIPLAGVVKPASVEPEPAPEPPLFAGAAPGALYLQIASVDKGMALLLAEGLRKRGFTAFAGPGPTEETFRILIGPLDDEAFRQTREALDQIGLGAFPRRFAR